MRIVCEHTVKTASFNPVWRHFKGLCNNYQEGGDEKLELSGKNVDSTPPPKQKKISSNPPQNILC